MIFDPPEHPSFDTFDMSGRLELLDSVDATQTLDPITRMADRTRIADDPAESPRSFPTAKSWYSPRTISWDSRPTTGYRRLRKQPSTKSARVRAALGSLSAIPVPTEN